MKKILFTLLLVLFTVPSLANAGVVGKGLKCEGEYFPSRDRIVGNTKEDSRSESSFVCNHEGRFRSGIFLRALAEIE